MELTSKQIYNSVMHGAQALKQETKYKKPMQDIFSSAFKKIEVALEATKEQLEVLRKANVVDSGAKGFTYFLEGVLYYIQTGKELDLSDHNSGLNDFEDMEIHDDNHGDEKFRYYTECLLEAADIEVESLKTFLREKGDSTVVAANKNKCRIYMDKLTIKPERILELSKESTELPTSSQPNPKQIENLFDYLSTYYDSAIVLTVSKALSGTYNNFKKCAKDYNKEKFKISIIDTKQNSGAEELKNQVIQLLGIEPAYIEETSSIVAVGAGQGAVALACILEKEEQ